MREFRLPLAGLALALVLGCGDGGSGSDSTDSSQGGEAGSATTGGTGSVTSSSSGGGIAGAFGTTVGGGNTAGGNAAHGTTEVTYPRPCSDVYAPDLVPEFELEIAAAELSLMEADCEIEEKVYRPATLTYGAETVDVMVRLKGNWSWRCEKKQFLISFNEVDPNARFHGLRKLVLDAPWYDTTMIAERFGFWFMQRVGAAWSCANNATLTLNGEYYGVYANVERLDKEYLQRHFPDSEADGNLYDGGVELRTNETTADVSRRDALVAATDVTTIAGLADLDAAVKVWAASAMLPDPDSYWAGVEINYFLYDHPTRGFLWLPYDMDMAVQPGVPDAATSTVDIGNVSAFVNADPFTYENSDWLKEPLLETVLSDATWCNRFIEELRLARDAYDVSAMTTQIDAWAAQVNGAVLSDPNKLFSNQDHLNGIATMKAMLPERLAFVDDWLLTASCPVTHWP